MKNNDDWLSYVKAFAKLYTNQLNQSAAANQAPSPARTSAIKPHTVLICSPHPDDETITGIAALRFLQEAGCTLFNLAMTLGSNPARKKERLKELDECCEVLGIKNVLSIKPLGIADLSLKDRRKNSSQWDEIKNQISNHFQSINPDIVIYPHEHDHHPTHEWVSLMIKEALQIYSSQGAPVLSIETECWFPMKSPNLLIGASDQDVALLCEALAKHKGEIKRNPYHLRQPIRMMENVFRGAEVVPGYGEKKLEFLFGELYTMSLYINGKQDWNLSPLVVAPELNIYDTLLNGIL